MNINLINDEDAKYAQKILNNFYKDKFIPAEKKSYLTDLRNSFGPYLGIKSSNKETHYILDAASQIATLGFGFNPSLFFGASSYLESWTNNSSTSEFKKIRKAFKNFFKRKLNWNQTHLTFVNSGAEANETALGYCYKNRINKKANKVLAFEGSFHGRMMITLAATWNKSKREPFEWKNYLAEYVKYPELPDSNIHLPFPDNWRDIWDNSSSLDFNTPKEWNDDEILRTEVESLLVIRSKLQQKSIFSIIIEPMQCEGGDCYSSDRFHTALLIMARTFQIPVIYDEVQTGFHLGREFFWHRQFNLTDSNGETLEPNYVVCAKKAQIGIVISHHETKNIFEGEEFSVASAIRGYVHAIGLDQYQDKILNMEKNLIVKLDKFLKTNELFLARPRANGLAFAFDLKEPSLLAKFVDLRFKYGLLYYPAGSQTLRFRLNLSFKDSDLDFLFEKLQLVCNEIFLNTTSDNKLILKNAHSNPSESYKWHQFLCELKSMNIQDVKESNQNIDSRINELVNLPGEYNLIEINASNFNSFRNQIIQLQKMIYEPVRQTEISKFEVAANHKNSICYAVTNTKQELHAISFAAPLNLFPFERGLRADPFYNFEDALYMLDVTVSTKLQNSGIGKNLKYATTAKALSRGIKKLQGRNRDRLASQMININLSLGAYEQNYLKEDYPDFENYRDVFYYTIPVSWEKPRLNLSNSINTPISYLSLNKNYIASQLPNLVNKMCLSNFVSEEFLKNIQSIASQLPLELRHVYTCSGQSECVDKIVKTIWVKSSKEIKDNNYTRLLSFNGHFFGNGSAISRSISYNDDPYFDVKKLEHPNKENFKQVLDLVENELKTGTYLSVWIEPLLQKTMEKVPYEFLKGLRELTIKYDVALVYNETASQFFRYSIETFFASSLNDIAPDAGMIFLSGQAGITFTSERFFLEQPLMLISTWDGDEFSFNTYFEAFKNVTRNLEKYKETKKKFNNKLLNQIDKFEISTISVENGIGYFSGTIPTTLQKIFHYQNDRFIVCPSFDSMLEYLNT